MKQQVKIILRDAPQFVAQLVREGVTFESYQDPNDSEILVINFLGGF